MHLRTISTEAELDELLASSSVTPVLLFKHSSSCSISSRAHSQIEKLLSSDQPSQYSAAIVVVQQARSLSNRIEERLGIRHETPQAIVLRDGKPVWNGSHWDVTESKLAEALAER